MPQALEFMQTEDPLGSFGQGFKGGYDPLKLLPRGDSGFRVGDVGNVLGCGEDMVRRAPSIVSGGGAVLLAQAIEHKIGRKAIEIGARIADCFIRLRHGDLEIEVLNEIFGFRHGMKAGQEEPSQSQSPFEIGRHQRRWRLVVHVALTPVLPRQLVSRLAP